MALTFIYSATFVVFRNGFVIFFMLALIVHTYSLAHIVFLDTESHVFSPTCYNLNKL